MRATAQHHGLGWAVGDVLLAGLNGVVVCRILKVLAIDEVDPTFTVADPRYRFGFLDRAELTDLARWPDYGLSPTVIAQALERGDECFAVRVGDVVANYGWYSTAPDRILPGVRLHFDPRYRYMHTGFTHPDYRGRRLHAVAMTLALQAYQRRGFRGLVSYVETTNRSSLKSVYRMGYRDCGTLYVLGLRGRYLVHATAGARARGFRLEVTPPEQKK